MSQLSHAQFPLRRHPNLLVDHRRSRSAAVAEPRGANGEAVTGSGGRLHFGMVAGLKSERWPTSNRNLEGYVRSPARRLGRRGKRPYISRIERRRGPVSLYGERSTATSNWPPVCAQGSRRLAIFEGFARSTAGIRSR